MANQFNIVSA